MTTEIADVRRNNGQCCLVPFCPCAEQSGNLCMPLVNSCQNPDLDTLWRQQLRQFFGPEIDIKENLYVCKCHFQQSQLLDTNFDVHLKSPEQCALTLDPALLTAAQKKADEHQIAAIDKQQNKQKKACGLQNAAIVKPKEEKSKKRGAAEMESKTWCLVPFCPCAKRSPDLCKPLLSNAQCQDQWREQLQQFFGPEVKIKKRLYICKCHFKRSQLLYLSYTIKIKSPSDCALTLNTMTSSQSKSLKDFKIATLEEELEKVKAEKKELEDTIKKVFNDDQLKKLGNKTVPEWSAATLTKARNMLDHMGERAYNHLVVDMKLPFPNYKSARAYNIAEDYREDRRKKYLRDSKKSYLKGRRSKSCKVGTKPGNAPFSDLPDNVCHNTADESINDS